MDVADVLVSDLDGDGIVDLYFVSPGNNVALLGDGTGRFIEATERLGLTETGPDVSAERLDLDGRAPHELLLHNATGDVIFWATAAGFERDPALPDTTSQTSVNGVGNLLVGYNETGNPGGDARTGSHNIVVGHGHSYTSFGGLVGSTDNTISGPFATVSGGRRNTASGTWSSVSGGTSNTASGSFSSLTGGGSNVATAFGATVSGGLINTASGYYSSVTSGFFNVASLGNASVSGGQSNTANNNWSSVSGGINRSAASINSWRAGSLFEAN